MGLRIERRTVAPEFAATAWPVRGAYLMAAAIAALITAGGCGETDATAGGAAVNVAGVNFGRDFDLTDHTGRRRSLADYRGKAVILFFGYTQCPDACPTTLSDLDAALRQLGPDGQRVQVLFVTVDPERDTQELLAQYVPAFNPSFVGLRGNAEETAGVAREFRITVVKFPQKNGRYTVDHSTGSYVFDARGQLRLHLPHGQPPRAIADDLRRLLLGSG